MLRRTEAIRALFPARSQIIADAVGDKVQLENERGPEKMPVALHPAPSSLVNRGEDSGMNLGHLSSTTNSANSGETESHQGQRCRFWDLLRFLWPFVHPRISPLAAH